LRSTAHRIAVRTRISTRLMAVSCLVSLVPAPPFARMAVGCHIHEASGTPGTLCAVARDGTLFGCGEPFKTLGEGTWLSLLARLPDPPALVRDVVCPALSNGNPSHVLHTTGQAAVQARVSQPIVHRDENDACTVEHDPEVPPGEGPSPSPSHTPYSPPPPPPLFLLPPRPSFLSSFPPLSLAPAPPRLSLSCVFVFCLSPSHHPRSSYTLCPVTRRSRLGTVPLPLASARGTYRRLYSWFRGCGVWPFHCKRLWGTSVGPRVGDLHSARHKTRTASTTRKSW